MEMLPSHDVQPPTKTNREFEPSVSADSWRNEPNVNTGCALRNNLEAVDARAEVRIKLQHLQLKVQTSALKSRIGLRP